MTYNVFGGMLNPVQSNPSYLVLVLLILANSLEWDHSSSVQYANVLLCS